MKLLLVAVIAAAATFAVFAHKRAEAAEGSLAAIAKEIAHRPVRVHCQGVLGAAIDVGAEAGSVEFDPSGRPADVTSLKRSVCRELVRFPKRHAEKDYGCALRNERCSRSVLRSMWAVQTLAHESWHLQGQRNEAVTECYGLQTTAWVAGRLGAPAGEGEAIARYLYRHIYPQMPQSYRSSECRDGGRLDLRPGSAIFP